jgi:hypothetical protein
MFGLRKNLFAQQYIYFRQISQTVGAPATGATVSVLVSIDGGAQAAGAGSVVEDGGGQYHYAPTQAETNGNDIGFLFSSTGNQPESVHCFTTAADPADGIAFGLTALPSAAAGANTGLPVVGSQVPNANAGASGGLLINGTNSGTVTLAALTCTGAFTVGSGIAVTGALTVSAGIAVTQSSSNAAALSLTGNGSGAGMKLVGGSTGPALSATNTTGDVIVVTAVGGNGNAVNFDGQGSGAGLKAVGGATGAGVSFVGGSSSGPAMNLATTSGNGVTVNSAACIDTNGRILIRSGLTKDVALNDFAIQMVSSTDHITPATGLTVAVQRSIDGGAFANATNTPATEVANGDYVINLSAADLNGGVIVVRATATGADPAVYVIITTP